MEASLKNLSLSLDGEGEELVIKPGDYFTIWISSKSRRFSLDVREFSLSHSSSGHGRTPNTGATQYH
ncbi:hypothetical protein ACS0TY_007912 [Phlomoides rotata]